VKDKCHIFWTATFFQKKISEIEHVAQTQQKEKRGREYVSKTFLLGYN
jgi:hypothetical protein